MTKKRILRKSNTLIKRNGTKNGSARVSSSGSSSSYGSEA